MAEGTEKVESGSDARRRILTIAVSTVLLENGFESTDKMALETLTEMLQCFLCEVGNSAKNYCELSGRVEPMLGDVIMALVNMGISLQGLEQYAARPNRHVIQPPQQAPAPRTPAMLSAGSKAKPAPHIPFHLPPLPDPHAYIRTPTHKQPVTEYEAIREKAASQKRDIERALTKFLAKTSETHNLFNTEDNQVFPYQVFDFDELEYHFQNNQTMKETTWLTETTQVVHKWTTLMQVWHPAQTEANLADNSYKKLQNLRLRTY
ncbi:hypothetical protein SFRURICE_016903 [Spodoptera frugiperda]|nr:hypothetical protein SFRURICE_016903 [Spodoptera frugiperda]